ncbi:MAG: hypothetical protein WBM07_04145 [Chitinivibrionales bacterium]
MSTAANCRSDGSVGVFASLAAVMSPMRQLQQCLERWYVKPSLMSFYRVTVFDVQPTTGHGQNRSLYPVRVSHPPVPSLACEQVAHRWSSPR